MSAQPFSAKMSDSPQDSGVPQSPGKPLRLRKESPLPADADSRPTDADDMALLAAHRAGDARALGILLESYQDRLFAVCLRMLGDRDRARDLTQDAMVKIIQGLPRFDGRSKLSTWMIRVTMNACLSELRKLRLRRHASLQTTVGTGFEGEGSTLESTLASGEPGTSAGVESGEDRADVSSALARITPEQRAILILRDMQGLDYATIADLLDIPAGTVKSRIFRARVALRERVEELRAARVHRPS